METKNTTGIDLIAAERRRQIEKKGYTLEHDRKHVNDELAFAAICYAEPTKRLVRIPDEVEETRVPTIVLDGRYGPEKYAVMPPSLWPWDISDWHPSPDHSPDERIRELSIAGAFIAAEIDRWLAIKDEKEEKHVDTGNER